MKMFKPHLRLGAALVLVAAAAAFRGMAAPEPTDTPTSTDSPPPTARWGVAAIESAGQWHHDLPEWAARPGLPNLLCLRLDRTADHLPTGLLLWHDGSAPQVALCDAACLPLGAPLPGTSLPLSADLWLTLYPLPAAITPSATWLVAATPPMTDLTTLGTTSHPTAPSALPVPVPLSMSVRAATFPTAALHGNQAHPGASVPAPCAAPCAPADTPAAGHAPQGATPRTPTLHVAAPRSGSRILW